MVVAPSSCQSISPRPLNRLTSILRLGCSASNARQGRVVLQVVALLADVGAEQRRLRDVDVALAHDLGELPVEEREQQRADVRAVDVGVGHQHDLVVAELGEVELLADAGADRGDEGLDLLVLQRAVEPSPLDVQDLPPDREDGLELGVAGALGGAAGAVALDDEQLAQRGVLRRAVGELARHGRRLEQRLAPGEVAGLAGRHPRLGGLVGLGQRLARLRRVLLEPVGQLLVGGPLDLRPHLGVAELGLGLALELRVAQLHRDDGGEPLPDVFAEEVRVLLLELALGHRVAVDHVGEGLLEALLVHAALGGGDVVGERVDALVEPGVPLHGDVDLVVVAFLRVGDHPLEQRLLRRVEVLDEVADAAVELEVLHEHGVDALVAEADLEALAEERHLAQALDERLGAELRLLEDGLVGPERDRRAVLLRRAGLGELVLGLPALGEVLHPLAAVAVDLDVEAARRAR